MEGGEGLEFNPHLKRVAKRVGKRVAKRVGKRGIGW